MSNVGSGTLRAPGQSTTAGTARVSTVTLAGDVPFGFLTPETLLAYCATKLRGLDTQIQEIFAKQQTRNAKAQVLSDLQSKLSNYKIGFEKNDTAEKEITAAFERAKTAFGGDAALSAELEKTYASFKASVTDPPINGNDGADHKASADEMTGWISSLQSMQQGLNQDGEMEMLQMQSMMSQRQQALQLCTNMVQSLGQSSQAICANVGK